MKLSPFPGKVEKRPVKSGHGASLKYFLTDEQTATRLRLLQLFPTLFRLRNRNNPNN